MSKKEIQSAATSSLMGCDGHVESSNVAVLAVLGYSQPPSKHTWLALHNWRAANPSPEAGNWAVNAQLRLLFPSPFSVYAPQHPRELGDTSAFAILWRGGKREWVPSLLHWLRRKIFQGLMREEKKADAGAYKWQGLRAKGSVWHLSLISDWRQAKLLLLGVAPSLALLSTPLCSDTAP